MNTDLNRHGMTPDCPLTRASGMHYYTPEGRPVLDGTAGDWHTGAGHCRAPIVAAIRNAAGKFDSAPGDEAGNGQIESLSHRLSLLVPPHLERVIFAGSGANARTKALKIARAHHMARHRAGEGRIILRAPDGHLCVAGDMPGLPARQETDADPVAELKALVAQHGDQAIAALVIEPLGAEAGMSPPTRAQLQALRDLATAHGILLVFDESLTAFGRLCAPTAAERLALPADMVVVAESMTNGAVPLGAVLCRSAIADSVQSSPYLAATPDFLAELSWRPDPVATAAALATLDLCEAEDIFHRPAELEAYWQDGVNSLSGAPRLAAVRSHGLAAALQLETRSGVAGMRGRDMFHRCFQYGLMTRVMADTILLSPPLIITQDQVDDMIEKLSAALRKLA